MIKLAKSKLIGIFAILMLVLNLGLMTFIFLNHRTHPEYTGPKQLILDRLEFNNEQVIAYEILIDDHRNAILNLENEIILVKADLYQNLGDDMTSNPDSLMTILGELQISIEQVHYHHFEAIRALCTEEQLPKFEVLKDELTELFMYQVGPPPKK